MKKKVLYFTSMPSPFQLEFITYVNKHSTSSEIIPVFMSEIKDYRKTWGESKAEYIVINEKGLFRRYKKIFSIIDKSNIETIILTQYSAIYSLLLLIYVLSKKIDYFIGPIENMHKRNVCFDWLKKQYFGIIAFKAKAVFAIGNHAAQDYAESYKGPVLNIPYTFDLSNLASSKREPSNEITFLYSGRLIPFRNPLLAIECFAEVAQEFDEVRLIMSGVGELRVDCDVLIDKLGIENKIVWKNNFNDWYDIHKNLYRQGDVLLALQVHATWGLIIQEAMASGLGIIATRTMEATNELIVDGYNGFLVGLHKDEIVSKMTKYIHDKELIELHGKRSKDIVDVIDLNNVGNNFINYFDEVQK